MQHAACELCPGISEQRTRHLVQGKRSLHGYPMHLSTDSSADAATLLGALQGVVSAAAAAQGPLLALQGRLDLALAQQPALKQEAQPDVLQFAEDDAPQVRLWMRCAICLELMSSSRRRLKSRLGDWGLASAGVYEPLQSLAAAGASICCQAVRWDCSICECCFLLWSWSSCPRHGAPRLRAAERASALATRLQDFLQYSTADIVLEL